MSGSTCISCGASGVILDHDGRCAGCPMPAQSFPAHTDQRVTLQRQRDAETDPTLREAYAMAKRAGFDWYDTESSARRAFEHAAREVVALRTVGQDLLRTFRRSMCAREWREWVGTSEAGPDVKNDAVVAAVALLGEPKK